MQTGYFHLVFRFILHSSPVLEGGFALKLLRLPEL